MPICKWSCVFFLTGMQSQVIFPSSRALLWLPKSHSSWQSEGMNGIKLNLSWKAWICDLDLISCMVCSELTSCSLNNLELHSHATNIFSVFCISGKINSLVFHCSLLDVGRCLLPFFVWMGSWSQYQPAFSVILTLQESTLGSLISYTLWLKTELRLLTVENENSDRNVLLFVQPKAMLSGGSSPLQGQSILSHRWSCGAQITAQKPLVKNLQHSILLWQRRRHCLKLCI